MLRSVSMALAAALLVLAVAAGCGKPQEEAAPAAAPKASAAPAKAPPAGSTTIQAKGSDTLLQVAQALAEAYKAVEPNVSVSVTGGGTGTGFKAIIDGTCDIADASRKIKDEETAAAKEKGIDLVENLVGYDGIAVIVNKDNPIEKITIDELASLFTAKTTDWSSLGGRGEVVILSRETTSGTYEYFKEHVLNGGDSKGKVNFAESAILLPSTDQIRKQVSETAGAVGYIGLGYLDESVKVVPIVAKDGSEVLPSVATVKDGSYPISRPLFMYTQKTAAAAVTKYIDWIKGKDAQAVVAKEGFVPL